MLSIKNSKELIKVRIPSRICMRWITGPRKVIGMHLTNLPKSPERRADRAKRSDVFDVNHDAITPLATIFASLRCERCITGDGTRDPGTVQRRCGSDGVQPGCTRNTKREWSSSTLAEVSS